MVDCLNWGVERWVPARMPGARWGRRVPVPATWSPSAMPCEWPAVQMPLPWSSPWRGFGFAPWPGAGLGVVLLPPIVV